MRQSTGAHLILLKMYNKTWNSHLKRASTKGSGCACVSLCVLLPVSACVSVYVSLTVCLWAQKNSTIPPVAPSPFFLCTALDMHHSVAQPLRALYFDLHVAVLSWCTRAHSLCLSHSGALQGPQGHRGKLWQSGLLGWSRELNAMRCINASGNHNLKHLYAQIIQTLEILLE